MKIALVTSSFLPKIGGQQFVVHHLAHQWYVQGHEVCVFNTSTEGPTYHAAGEYAVRRFKMLRGSCRFGHHWFPFEWYARRQLERLLKEFEPDFISAHVIYPTGYWLSKIKPLPKFLVTCHGGEITKSYWGFRKRHNIDKQLTYAMKKSAGVIAISRHARELMEELGVESTHILDIPNGVDLDSFQTKVDIDIRSKLGIPKDAVIILSVGRDHPAKAYDTGIKAFAKLDARVSDVFYVILGRGVTKWRALASELGVEKRVILCEGLYDDELIAVYQQADIFFSSSNSEMLALVVLEAMAAGLPEVVTDISGSQDVIETGINGFVVEPNKPGEMAEALHKLATDESLRKRMGTANLAKSKFYGWDRVSRLYLEHG